MLREAVDAALPAPPENQGADMGHAEPKSATPGLTDCQIRIMASLESCHNTRTECTPTNVRARYVALYGTPEKPGRWERDAKDLCLRESIFTVNGDGTWELTAWKLQRGPLIPKLISGSMIMGESGGNNVANHQERLR